MSKYYQCARCLQFCHHLYYIIDPATGRGARACDLCERRAAMEREFGPGGPWRAGRQAGKAAGA